MESDPTSSSPQPHEDQPADQQAHASVAQTFAELREYFIYYTTARLDAFKVSLRRLLFWTGVILMALLAVTAIAVMAIVLVCIGISDALTQLFHSQWLGELATGLLLMGGALTGAYIGLGRLHAAWHSKRLAKFQDLRRRQRERFGHDVSDIGNGNEPHTGG